MKKLARTWGFLMLFLAGSHGVLGQNTLLVNDIQPLLAYASEIQNEIELSVEVTASSYQFYMEEKVQLEGWMLEHDKWMNEPSMDFVSAIRVEPETELAVESWMIHPIPAVHSESWEFLEVEQEEPIKLQPWMICCAGWDTGTLQNHPSEGPAKLD